ncbi:MAG: hypothetical protein QW115_07400, partial [Thermoplasmata archaeon]
KKKELMEYLKRERDIVRDSNINGILERRNNIEKFWECKERYQEYIEEFHNPQSQDDVDFKDKTEFWLKIWDAVNYRRGKEKRKKGEQLMEVEERLLNNVDENERQILESLYSVKVCWDISRLDAETRMRWLAGTYAGDTSYWFIRLWDLVDAERVLTEKFQNKYAGRITNTILTRFLCEDFNKYFSEPHDGPKRIREFIMGFRELADAERRENKRWELTEDMENKLEEIKRELGMEIDHVALRKVEEQLEEVEQRKKELEAHLDALTKEKREIEAKLEMAIRAGEEEKERMLHLLREREEEIRKIQESYMRISEQMEEREEELEKVRTRVLELEEIKKLEEEARNKGCHVKMADACSQEMIFSNVVKSNLANRVLSVYFEKKLHEVRCNLKPWEIIEERRTDWNPGEPKNIIITAYLNEDLLSRFTGAPKIKVRAYFRTRPGVLRQMGFDYRPMSRFVRAIVEKEQHDAEEGKYLCILCIASPTGFDEESKKLVKEYSSRFCIPFLLKTSSWEMWYRDSEEGKVFSKLFEKDTAFDAAYKIAREIEMLLLRYPEGIISKRSLKALLQADALVLEEAISFLTAGGKVKILKWEDKVRGREIGEVLKKVEV